MKFRDVEVEVNGVDLAITVEVFGDRRERPDCWWGVHCINVIDEHTNLDRLLLEFSSRGKWYSYDELMDAIDDALVEQEAMV